MKVYKAYRFRLYPSEEQKMKINNTLGCSRFVYNYYLQLKKEKYEEQHKSLSCFDMIKDLKELESNYPWLKEVDSLALRTALFDLDDSFKRFFQGQTHFPVYKKKNSKNTYRTSNIKSTYKENSYESIKLDLIKKVMILPKLKEIIIRGYRNLTEVHGNVKSATISKEANGKYYVAVLVETEIELPKKQRDTIVGLDLGVKDLVITSNHEKHANEKAIDCYENRIKKCQRRLAKRVRGSKNYLKMKRKIGVLYSKLQNARKYVIHALTKKIVKENDIIVSETLNILPMTKNSFLAKRILDASFSEIIRQLEYKSKWQNKEYIQVNPYYPSSQLCSRCGFRNKEVRDLRIREWECERCGSNHDRDYNAAENILFEGLRKYVEKLV